jgi:hypothetical protein
MLLVHLLFHYFGARKREIVVDCCLLELQRLVVLTQNGRAHYYSFRVRVCVNE